MVSCRLQRPALGGRLRSRPWAAYWALVAALVAGHAAHALVNLGGHGLDSLFADWIYSALYFSPLPPVLHRAWTKREERRPWCVLAFGLASYGLGTVVYSVFYALQASPPFPSPADGMWLVVYPCSIAAIALLFSARLYRANRILLLDGAVGALTACAGLSALTLHGLTSSVHGGLIEHAVTLAYPLGDLVLLSIVVTAFAAMGWRPDRFWALLGGGFLVLAVADTFYVSMSAAGTYKQGGILDTCWPLAMLLIGLAARRPQRVGTPQPYGSMVLLVPAIAGAALVLLEVVHLGGGLPPVSAVLAAVALAALIMRLLVSLVQVQRLAASHDQARTDPLTGLLNRRGFEEQLAEEAERSVRSGAPLAVAVFDLDRFKHLNDRFGHAGGDRALCRFAELLRRCVRQIDTIARLGGEEFVMLAPATDEEGALNMAERVRLAVEQEFESDLALTVSAGVAVFPEAGSDPEDAVQAADDALYAAKRAGRNRCLAYREREMRRAARHVRRSASEADEIVRVLERADSIVPQFQPIVALTTGHVAGYEALARFPGPSARPPDAWFAQARACGLGPELEAHALHAALAVADRPPGSFLTLNVSPSALRSPALERVLPVDLSDLVFELTEHEVIASDRLLDDVLAALRERGARIALDDVGSAYSGLQSVVSVRPDIIKIDRELTSDVHQDPAKSALIESFVSFAARTGAAVCAEGVEELEEAVFLADLDVLYAQGYALSRPAAPWTTISQAVSEELLLRSLRGDSENGTGAFLPDTGDRRLEVLSGRLSAVGSIAELEQLMPLVARELNAEDALVSSWQPGLDHVLTLTGVGPGVEERYWLADYPETAHALRSQESVQVLLDDQDADAAESALLREQGYRALLMVPIVNRGQSSGLLEAFSRVRAPWSRTSINRARIIAYQLGALLATLGVGDSSPSDTGTSSAASSSPASPACTAIIAAKSTSS